VIVHQALHGVGKGHQLLHTSADLTREEHWTLEQLSDLCGQLEPDEDFEYFDCGYPCGRWRVVARTWIDRDVPRKGTVLTHSLLLDPVEAEGLDDLGRLDPLFRKPQRGEDRAPWGRRLEVELGEATVFSPDPETRLRLLASVLLVALRPQIWLEQASAADAARLAWMALHPKRRGGWSWCTRALNPRYLDNRPLQWMAPGPNSRSGFLNLGGATIGPKLPGPLDQAARAMGLDGVDGRSLAAIWGELPAEQPEARMRLIFRLARFRGRDDLQAALGCLDVDEALDLRDTPLVTGDVDRARAWVGGPAPAERSLVDLSALLVRRPWLRATARTRDLQALCVETLAARIPRINADEEKALAQLARAAHGSPLEAAVREGVQRGLASAPMEVRQRLRGVLG